jgi:cell division protein FtsB
MAEFKNPFRRVQVEFRRGSALTKVIVMVAIVLSMTALLTLRLAQNHVQAQTEEMRAQAAQLEQENAELTEKLGKQGSIESVQEIAEEELGLVDPDTVVIKPE